MLKQPSTPARLARRQSGVVLLIALIVLIGMTLAGLALMRSVDTLTLIAGNLSFQQAAVHSGDTGIETAVAWIENNPTLLNADSSTNGYAANGLTVAPAKLTTQTWDAYWQATWSGRAVTGTADASGNTVSRVIDRLCLNAGSPTSGALCSVSPATNKETGNLEEGGEKVIDASALVYYRITTRVQGPHNAVSFVQAVISR